MIPGAASGGARSAATAHRAIAISVTPTSAVRLCSGGIGGGARMEYRSGCPVSHQNHRHAQAG
jgi:hypothetical protein